MSSTKAIAFDLDDTLLDTSGILVPTASSRACQALLDEGLGCSLEQCLIERQTLSTTHSHKEIFRHIAEKYGTRNQELAVANALEEFYNPQIPEILPLLPGALENLKTLSSRYMLFLVTMGSLPAQKKKIAALGISTFFKEIFILDGFKGEKKESAFRTIIQQNNLIPYQLLSVGNRLSSEIRDGKRCGTQTCYFAYGEHAGERPEFPEDQPDMTVFSHRELIETCVL